MEKKLYIITCENYRKEIAKVLDDEKFEGVSPCTILSSCGRPIQEVMDDISEIILKNSKEHVQFIIIGGACCTRFEDFFQGSNSVSVYKNPQCFNMLVNNDIVESYINEGAYIVSPGWLVHWKEYMDEWRFGRDVGMPFYKGKISGIVLFDTGLDSESVFHLNAFGSYTGLNYKFIKVGLDHLKMMIKGLVCEWRLNTEREYLSEALALADSKSLENELISKFSGTFASETDEEKIICKTFDLLEEAFDAKRFCFIPAINGSKSKIQYKGMLLEECLHFREEIFNGFLFEEHIYVNDGKGIAVSVRHQGDLIGVIVAEDILLKKYLSKNTEIIRTISGMLGSAIINARRYQEKVDSEKVVKEKEVRLSRITESMLDVIGQINLEGVLEYISPSCKSVMGYGPEEIMGKPVFDFFSQDDVIVMRELMLKAFSSGMQLTQEFRFRRSDGQYIWLEIVGRAVADENGEIRSISFSCRDVSARKLLEDKLRISEERYRLLIDVLPDAIFIHYEGKIMFCNKAAACLIGVRDPLELYGKSVVEFLHKDYRQAAVERFKRIIDDRTGVSIGEEKIVCKDGNILDTEVVSISYLYKGRPMILEAVRDISERRHIEELRKKVDESNRQIAEVQEYDKLKTEFFANISHEFRTPINILLGSLQLLDFYQKYDMLQENKVELESHIKVMRQNCYRLLRMANNIIDISRIESGFYEVHLRNLDIVSHVEDITLSAAEYIENKGRGLVFDTDIEEKIMAFDPEILERIMLNLLSNAVKFTNPGNSIMVNMFDKGESITISVRDTGIGIPSDKLDMIFQKFRQVDKSLTRAHEGSGIGLSIVKSLVEIMEGNISVRSEYGKGSEFILELPANYCDNEDAESELSKVVERGHVERMALEFSDIYS